jgi:AraC-like DNA-binding protein
MSTDALSEVLRAVRLTGAVFFKVDSSAPWVAEAPEAKWIAPHVLPGTERVIEYHVITRGSCWGGVVGEPPIELHAGDVLVFPQGDRHVLSSAPGMRGPEQPEALFHRPADGQLPVALSLNSAGGDITSLVCGFIGCDARPFNPLLATLPRVIHVKRKSGGDSALLDHLIRVAVEESSAPRAGGQTMLARLSELLFIEVVRSYCAELPSETKGWLAGVRDDVVGRALGLLHDRPAECWSLESLAKEVGSSRSIVAERFSSYIGTPPMHYLARWRMQLAAALLSGTNATLAEVAERVGYGSEAAFSRAFKRLVGVAPSAWREGSRPDIAYVPADDAELVSLPPTAAETT